MKLEGLKIDFYQYFKKNKIMACPRNACPGKQKIVYL